MPPAITRPFSDTPKYEIKTRTVIREKQYGSIEQRKVRRVVFLTNKDHNDVLYLERIRTCVYLVFEAIGPLLCIEKFGLTE